MALSPWYQFAWFSVTSRRDLMTISVEAQLDSVGRDEQVLPCARSP